MSKIKQQFIDLKQVVGRGYRDFWEYSGIYLVVKGGRGSKKSTTTALKLIYKMMEYYHQYNVKPNVLVVRKTASTLTDSAFSQLKWAIHRLNVTHLWKSTKNPLCLTYLPSGQQVLFKGLDDPLKITSITVDTGHLCWLWIEEAYEIDSEEDFNKLDFSIRGKLPEPLYKQVILTLNPWSEKHWIKRRFYDNPDKHTLALTKNYELNEHLDERDLALFEAMKERDPRAYEIIGKGKWGIIEGRVYDNWEEKDFNKEILEHSDFRHFYGLDFGYAESPTAFIAIAVKGYDIYIYDEMYKTKMLNRDIVENIRQLGYNHKRIYADSEDPKSIEELRISGLPLIKPCKKGKNSVLAGIQKLRGYHMYVHPSCVNAIKELEEYRWDSEKVNVPVKLHDHLMDALRYACEPLGKRSFSWEL